MVSRTRQGFGELKWHAPHYEKSWKILKKVYSNFAFKNHVYIALCMQTCYPKPLFWVPVSPLITSIVLDYFYTNTSSLLCSTKWKKVHPITPKLACAYVCGMNFQNFFLPTSADFNMYPIRIFLSSKDFPKLLFFLILQRVPLSWFPRTWLSDLFLPSRRSR